MAHSAPPSIPPTGTRRPFEIFLGVAALVLGILLVIVAITALHHPKGRRAQPVTSIPTNSSDDTAVPSASKTASKSPTATTTKPTPTATATSSAPGTSASTSGTLPLVVLNNTSSTTATTAAGRFTAGGWTVTSTSTFSGDILSTAAYYDPDVPGAQAAALKLQQQFPAIQRVKEKFDGLPAGPIVVVLTSDYS